MDNACTLRQCRHAGSGIVRRIEELTGRLADQVVEGEVAGPLRYRQDYHMSSVALRMLYF